MLHRRVAAGQRHMGAVQCVLQCDEQRCDGVLAAAVCGGLVLGGGPAGRRDVGILAVVQLAVAGEERPGSVRRDRRRVERARSGRCGRLDARVPGDRARRRLCVCGDGTVLCAPCGGVRRLGEGSVVLAVGRRVPRYDRPIGAFECAASGADPQPPSCARHRQCRRAALQQCELRCGGLQQSEVWGLGFKLISLLAGAGKYDPDFFTTGGCYIGVSPQGNGTWEPFSAYFTATSSGATVYLPQQSAADSSWVADLLISLVSERRVWDAIACCLLGCMDR